MSHSIRRTGFIIAPIRELERLHDAWSLPGGRKLSLWPVMIASYSPSVSVGTKFTQVIFPIYGEQIPAPERHPSVGVLLPISTLVI